MRSSLGPISWLIHPSAQNRYSRKIISSMLHNPPLEAPLRPCRHPACAGVPCILLPGWIDMRRAVCGASTLA